MENNNKIIQPFFYKFMSINKYTYDNLNNNQIWFTSPLEFNDPFDCLIPHSLDFTDEEFKKIVPKLPNYSDTQYKQMIQYYKENPKELVKWGHVGLKRFLLKLGVACFCEEKTNILMWSHYADFHKGLCLKFDTTIDYHFFHEEDWNIKKLPIKKVNYPAKHSLTNFFKNNEDFFENNICTKYHGWKYEKEWRIIAVNKGPIQFKKECLIEINFGCKCDLEDKNIKKIVSIIKANKYPNVSFLLAKRCKDRFGLEFEKIKI